MKPNQFQLIHSSWLNPADFNPLNKTVTSHQSFSNSRSSQTEVNIRSNKWETAESLRPLDSILCGYLVPLRQQNWWRRREDDPRSLFIEQLNCPVSGGLGVCVWGYGAESEKKSETVDFYQPKAKSVIISMQFRF